MKNTPIGISNRHIHLSASDASTVFGVGYLCEKMKDLSQPGQYACKETVSIRGPKGQIDGVRILGPYREETQIEILQADNFKLGTNAPIRLSGDLQNSGAIEIIGPKGSIQLSQGLIIAQRHLHASPAEAKILGLHDGQTISIAIKGQRAVLFGATIVRITESSSLDMHIDIEEANAAGIIPGTEGEIID